jgi:hypothetical protein
MKVFRLQFGFIIFWRKDFGVKAAHKMLVKLTPGGRNWQLISPHTKYGKKVLYVLPLKGISDNNFVLLLRQQLFFEASVI